MELIVKEETDKRLVFDLKGEGHTLCNMLTKELNKNKHIKIAAYRISHPLIGIPTVTVETDSNLKVRKAVSDAISSLSSDSDKIKKEFKKIKW